jgi:hypothetical protein
MGGWAVAPEAARASDIVDPRDSPRGRGRVSRQSARGTLDDEGTGDSGAAGPEGGMRVSRVGIVALGLVGSAVAAGAQPAAGKWVDDPITRCQVWVGAPLAADRVSWSGACERGHAEGRGVMRRYVGDRVEAEYVGEYHDGRRAGRGVATAASGARYDGQWQADQYEGRGSYQGADGSRYDGDWHHSRPSGRGAWVYANGERYEGELREGEYSGQGVYTWPNGDRYDGAFRDGRPDGAGTLRAANGAVYEGTWTRGCLRRGGAVVAVLLAEATECP